MSNFNIWQIGRIVKWSRRNGYPLKGKALKVTTTNFRMTIKLAREPNTHTNEASASILVLLLLKTCVKLL
ncbi:hypothetical protein HanXRQr2_Chr04g0175611 [Helianthus annuus]|uniref:Uncharacterized protein n=1 Tax=Helianthus annuus TaxID=4232 RepID=A0A251V023_HELAN|nr:hypothetical protein HanXRQr2_Chr04g0175611 [Helianthus annuus]